MTKEQAEHSIEEHYNKAYDIAFSWLKNHLVFMFKANEKKLRAIQNSMGSVAFYRRKNGTPMWTHEEKELKGYSELTEFLHRWNALFHLTGDPIRIDDKGVRTEF